MSGALPSDLPLVFVKSSTFDNIVFVIIRVKQSGLKKM